MEVISAYCECCGWKEKCTQEYVGQVKANFNGKWICGICSDAVDEEMKNGRNEGNENVEDALKAHMTFCSEFKSKNAAIVKDWNSTASKTNSSTSSSSIDEEEVGEISSSFISHCNVDE